MNEIDELLAPALTVAKGNATLLKIVKAGDYQGFVKAVTHHYRCRQKTSPEALYPLRKLYCSLWLKLGGDPCAEQQVRYEQVLLDSERGCRHQPFTEWYKTFRAEATSSTSLTGYMQPPEPEEDLAKMAFFYEQPATSKRDSTMNFNAPAFKTVHYIYGVDVSTMSESDLILALKKVEEAMDDLGKIRTSSKKIATLKAELDVMLGKIVEALDAK